MPIVYSSAKTHSIECVLDFGSNFIPTITLFFIILSWTFFILVRTTNFGPFGFFGYRGQKERVEDHVECNNREKEVVG